MSPPETSHRQSDPRPGCARADDRLTAYLDGELPPRQAREVEEHLRQCAVCLAEVGELRFAMGAIRRALGRPSEQAPPELLASLREAVGGAAPAPAGHTVGPTVQPGEIRGLLLRVGGMALAACFLLVVALTMHLGQAPDIQVARDDGVTPGPGDSYELQRESRKARGAGHEEPEGEGEPRQDQALTLRELAVTQQNGASGPAEAPEAALRTRPGTPRRSADKKEEHAERETAKELGDEEPPADGTALLQLVRERTGEAGERDEETTPEGMRELQKGSGAPAGGGVQLPSPDAIAEPGASGSKESADAVPTGPEGEAVPGARGSTGKARDRGRYLEEELEEGASEEREEMLRRSRLAGRLQEEPADDRRPGEDAPAPGSRAEQSKADSPAQEGKAHGAPGGEPSGPPGPAGARVGRPMEPAAPAPAEPPAEQPVPGTLVQERLGVEQPLRQVRIQFSTAGERRRLLARVRPYLTGKRERARKAAEFKDALEEEDALEPQDLEDQPHAWGMLSPSPRVRLALTVAQLEELRAWVERQGGGLAWLPRPPAEGDAGRGLPPPAAERGQLQGGRGSGVRGEHDRGADSDAPLLQVELVLIEEPSPAEDGR